MRLVLAAVALVGRAVCENVSYAYAPLDAVVGDRMAQMVGFESLDELAGPLSFATSGEVVLLVSGSLMLLEALAPHLLWRRRGPCFVDDGTAGSVDLGASRSPGASFAATTMYKLRHDIEQFEYLASRGWRRRWVETVVVPAYREVLRKVERKVVSQKNIYAIRGHTSDGATALLNGFYQLDPVDRILLGATYNRALVFAGPHTALGARLPGGDAALSDAADWAGADAEYLAGEGSAIAVLDDALSPDALEALQEYCRSATVFFETKPHNAGGHDGAYVVDGFAAPLLLQVAEELRQALPHTLADKPLLNFWAYKYQHAEPGIAVHRDQSSVNVNLWLTPTAANLTPDRGGMRIYDDGGDLDMADGETPAALLGPDADRILADFPSVAVPYEQNRLVLFDSHLLHASDVGDWKPGYLNRRTSLTFLFGDPSKVVVEPAPPVDGRERIEIL